MSKIYFPSRVSISVIMHSSLCFVSTITFATINDDGKPEAVTVTTDIIGDDVNNVVMETYFRIEGLYHNISTIAPVVTLEGEIMMKVGIQEQIELIKQGFRFDTPKKKVIH